MAVDIPKAFLMACVLFLTAACATSGHARESRAAVLRSGLAEDDPALAEAVEKSLGRAGYAVSQIDFAGLVDPSVLNASELDLLLLPDSSTLPAKSAESIQGFLRAGGDIIALNAPLWQRAVINVGGKWLTREEYQLQTAADLPEHVLFDFAPGDIADWRRASNTMEAPTTAEVIPDGPAPGQGALHVTIPNLSSWDTFGPAEVKNAFPTGHTLTVFSARGDAKTTQLAIEWDERDGSRWMAVIALTPQWKRYVLRPEDFSYWISVPNRGGRGDRFHPENAVSMSVGLAHTHTTAIGSGRFEYWVGPFGTARMTPEFQEVLNAADPPALDTLSPTYKLFDCTEVKSLVVRSDQVVVPETQLSVPSVIRSPHPRPKGGGFDKGRDWRWIPLLEARTEKGEWRGNPATLTVHAAGRYKGGVWASFGIGNLDWYKSPAVQGMISDVARKMKDGLFILDAGTRFYTHFEDQPVTAGFNVVNTSPGLQTGLLVRLRLLNPKSDEVVNCWEWRLDVESGEVARNQTDWRILDWPRDGLIAEAAIFHEEREVDRVTHEVHVWKPKKEKRFVTTQGGEFILDGKTWRPCGVNYMPSSGIGTEDGQYFEHYLSARSYDPEVFQRDIEHIKDLGYNAVSIFIYSGHEKAQNLNDLLRRLDALGLKANLSLRPGTPMDFLWPQISGIIENARLRDNDTVFAYDLAWEPMFGHQRDRVVWDGEWEKWILERYGSIENAERDWAFPVPRDEDGRVTNPLPHQIDSNGEWDRMSAAYRRFLDTLLYKKYGRARRLVRSVDPNHLVSFRMAEATNPTYHWEGRIPYDFPYLAAGVDFLAPEAYGRIGEWEKVKPGWFQRAYARWAAPEMPMIWAEQGCSVWDISRMRDSEERMDFQARHYAAFYEMLTKSGANGIFSWWYPGGFRVGENSDFGIINPDGSDRAVTRVIRNNAPKFISGPPAKSPDFWINIDRDRHPDGVAGIYDEVQARFWAAIEKGFTPGLRTDGTGTTSADCPLIAVGNTPCNGSNPPKYLDAAIDSVQVKGADGKWIEVDKDGEVAVKAGEPVIARVGFTNLGEAALLAPRRTRQTGVVYMVARIGDVETRAPLSADVSHLGSAVVERLVLSPAVPDRPTRVVITFDAQGRTSFGEKFAITLRPVRP